MANSVGTVSAPVASQPKIHVRVTSLDGSLNHPFPHDALVGDVHRYSYDKLVKQTGQIPFDRTWIEFKDQRQEPSTALTALVDEERHGEPDLLLKLVWDTGGGC